MIGRVLGNRYEIIEEIGSGGMANVYKAHCKLLNRQVAVKVLKRELVEDTEYLKRFNTEAQAAASLVHPNIVSIFDFGSEQDSHYIVMELIDGITLKQYINEKGKLEIKEALNIAYQICDALCVAHQNKIVHRDIKPHNIMITPDMRVKVTDFGIARASVGSTMTADNTILGSVHYISPEQARGTVVDGKTDLYSLGIVLYEMLAGKVPFECESPVAVAMKHIEEVAVDPREYNSEITFSVQQMVMKAISKDINERYQSAEDFKSDIMKLIENPDAIIDIEPIETTDNDGTLKIPVTTFNEEQEFDEEDFQVDFEKKNQQLKKTNKRILIFAVITAFIIVLGLSVYISKLLFGDKSIFINNSQNLIVVPDFHNMHLKDAENKAKELGLKLEADGELESDSIIVKQSPGPNESVSKGTVIKVMMSSAENSKPLTEMTDYVGTMYKTAQQELEDLGVEVDIKYEFSDDIRKDLIIRQNPLKGTDIYKDSVVYLYVSKGSEIQTVIVPEFQGKNLEQVQMILVEEGLKQGKITYEKSNSIDSGLVISQSIESGTEVEYKTKIDFVISEGADQDINVDKTKELVYKFKNTNAGTIRIVDEDGIEIFNGLAEPKKGDFIRKVKGNGKKSYDVYIDEVFAETIIVDFEE